MLINLIRWITFYLQKKLILHPVALNRPGTRARDNNSCWEWCIWFKASQALHVLLCLHWKIGFLLHSGHTQVRECESEAPTKIWKSSRISRTPCKFWNWIWSFLHFPLSPQGKFLGSVPVNTSVLSECACYIHFKNYWSKFAGCPMWIISFFFLVEDVDY